VEHQRTGFQRFFEFFLTECNCLVVVVRTDNIEVQAIAHEPSYTASVKAVGQFSMVA
jgi:hypothetical protein